jgi:hypothetical protein
MIMTSSTFNGVTYATKLKNAGMEPRVADVIAEETEGMLISTLATKTDLEMLRLQMQGFMIRGCIAMIGILGGLQVYLK